MPVNEFRSDSNLSPIVIVSQSRQARLIVGLVMEPLPSKPWGVGGYSGEDCARSNGG